MRAAPRRVLVPAISGVAMLAVLISLGVWQLQRRTWKLGILAQIDAAEAGPPAPLAGDPPQFAKVVAHGRFEPALAADYGSEVRELPGGAAIGSYLLTPLLRDDGQTVLVNRGWAPTDRRAPLVTPDGGTAVSGYIRQPDRPGWFSPQDDLARRHFYTLDARVIGAALGLAKVEPFVLVAMGPAAPGVFPAPAQHLPRPPNDHLNYALTWFGLAATLVAVLAAYLRKALRT